MNLVDITTKQIETVHIANRHMEELESSLYIVDVAGGEPQKVSTDEICFWHGWSPDGNTLAYTGYKKGNLDVYTIPVIGGKAKRLTKTEGLDDGPEYSTDGKYISYIEDQKQQHLFGKKVKLRLMNLETKEITDLTSVFYGGQGTINVPSWSPDSKRVAFVSYSIGN